MLRQPSSGTKMNGKDWAWSLSMNFVEHIIVLLTGLLSINTYGLVSHAHFSGASLTPFIL
ncbi:MAG TPA: hypothetical protein VHY08_24745 [Bacillota bacterium]|nr:hypothetical protein [Bacillota bacterium]